MEKKNQQISRNTYKRIKSMDRAQLSNYITQIYLTGFDAGRKAGTPDVLFRTIRELLLDTKDIGPTRAEAIMKKLGSIFAPQESGEQTEEAEGTPVETTRDDDRMTPRRPFMKAMDGFSAEEASVLSARTVNTRSSTNGRPEPEPEEVDEE